MTRSSTKIRSPKKSPLLAPTQSTLNANVIIIFLKNIWRIFFFSTWRSTWRNTSKPPCVCDHLPRRNRDSVNVILAPKPDKCKIMIMCGLMIFNKKYNYVWFDDFQQTSQELRMLSSVTINCQITKIVMNSGSQLSEL